MDKSRKLEGGQVTDFGRWRGVWGRCWAVAEGLVGVIVLAEAFWALTGTVSLRLNLWLSSSPIAEDAGH
jgi:hypothetical protein